MAKVGTKTTEKKVGAITIKLSSLTPDNLNANKGIPRGTGMLEESLRKFGAGRSILADKNLRVIAGNKTIEGAASIGLEDVIVVQSDGTKLVVVQRTDLDLDDPKTRELAIADNRTGEINLTWDPDALLALQQQGADLSAYFREDELMELLDGVISDSSPPAEAEEAEDDVLLGYAILRDGVVGRALLDARKNNGMELVKRLKDLEDEGEEWSVWYGGQMAKMAMQSGVAFDIVTYPPGSGKRGHSLSRVLAGSVAEIIGVPCEERFINEHPRGSRAVVASKLSEDCTYSYSGSGKGESVLLVDDAYCTGRSLQRCASVMRADSPWLCVLARS